jgi:hypothetical protein
LASEGKIFRKIRLPGTPEPYRRRYRNLLIVIVSGYLKKERSAGPENGITKTGFLCPVSPAGPKKRSARENSSHSVSDTYLNDFILIFVRESLWALSINLEIS